MTWPFDPLQSIAPEESEQAEPLAEEGALEVGQESKKRTNVDDVLDAVAGQRRLPAKKPDYSKCPHCASPMKRCSSAIGISTITMRCTNRACRLEIPVASIRTRIDAPPPPPNPLFGGPYRGNPDRGGGAPPIDPHEPINRRLAELTRRMNEND